MSWILIAIFTLVFLGQFSFITTIILLGMLFLLIKIREAKAVEEKRTQSAGEEELADLTLLHLKLAQLREDGQLDPSVYERLNRQLIKRFTYLCERQRYNRGERRRRLESAWTLLEKNMGQTLGPPPWQQPPSEKIPEKPNINKGKAAQQDTAEFIPVSEVTPVAAKTPVQMSEQTVPSLAKKTAQKDITAQRPPADKPPTSEPSPSPVLSPVKKQERETFTASPPKERAPGPKKNPSPPVAQPIAAKNTLPEQTKPPLPRQTPAPKKKDRYKPEKPSALEAFMSGWVKQIYRHRPTRAFLYQIMVPFFLQNIGWFIAGICGISGSIYLLAATTGYWKAFAVVISLVGYTSILLGGGYLLRRKRPELITSSGILLALGVLLVPLNLTACVRLLAAAGSNGIFLALAAILAVLLLSSFSLAVRLASGLIDRSLSKEHPLLFMGLASLQFFVPVLNSSVHWLWLAGLHLILLAGLGYALQRFTHHWLRSIFLDKRKIAYYAAGTLVYAALVSFIHLTSGSGMALPQGYAGPFLMILSALLFSVDIHLKNWVQSYAPLSRFTFVIYSLSVLALLLSLPGGTGGDHLFTLPLFLSLVMGVLLYGGMVWKYLTLPPLYLLLACFSALYAQAVLQFFPAHWHFLLSLPGFSAIMGLHRLAQRRNSKALGLVAQRTMLGLIPMLVLWSLWHSPFPAQGVIPMLTPLAGAALVLYILGLTLANLFQADKSTSSKGYYMLTGLLWLTLAYAPLLMERWSEQFSSGLIALAYMWTGWGLRSLRQKILGACEALINSALLSLAFGLFVITGSWLITSDLSFSALLAAPLISCLLIAAGGGILWLSLSLRIRTLFYGAMLIGGTGLALLKLRYIPVSSGKGILLAALALWVLQWHLQRRFVLKSAITNKLNETNKLSAAASISSTSSAALVNETDKTDKAESANTTTCPNATSSFRLFGLFTVPRKSFSSRNQMVIPPLRQFFYLLWFIGFCRICPGIFLPHPDFSWAILALLGALTTLLAAGQRKTSPDIQVVSLTCLLPLVVILLIKALLFLIPLSTLWHPCLIMGAALLLWRCSFFLRTTLSLRLIKILGWQGGYGTLSGSKLSEQSLHWTAFFFAFFSTGLACRSVITAAQGGISFRDIPLPFIALLITLILVLLFLWQSGRHYTLRLHSYLFIDCAALMECTLYIWLANLSLPTLPQVGHAAPMLTLIATVLAPTAYLLKNSDESLYRRPAQHHAILLFFWALAYDILLFGQNLNIGNSVLSLPWCFLALAFSGSCILPTFPDTVRLRNVGSIATALLLSLALISFFTDNAYLFPYILTAWSFVLLGTGILLLPRFTTGFPSCFLSPGPWPVLGLALVLGTLFTTLFARLLSPELSSLPFWPILVGTTVYLLLMSLTVEWAWLPWLTGLALTLSGLSLLLTFLPQEQYVFALTNPPFLISSAVWLNLAIEIMPLILRIRGKDKPSSITLHRLQKALFVWPSLLLCAFLVLFPLVITVSLHSQPTVYIALAIVQIVSFFHLFIISSRFSLRWRFLFAHLLLLALTDSALLLKTAVDIFEVPLLFVLWAALLQTILFLSPSRAEEEEALSLKKIFKKITWKWLPFLYTAALLTLPFTDLSPQARLLTLVLLSGLSIALLFQKRWKEETAELGTGGTWLLLTLPFLSYCWAAGESLYLLLAKWPQTVPVWLPAVFVLLALGQIPLLSRSSETSRILRGVAVPLLLTLAFVSLFNLLPFAAERTEFLALAVTAWAFILWGAGTSAFPRFNERWPQWAISPDFSLTLSFILLLGSVGTYTLITHHLSWPLLTLATLYLFLLQGNAGWQWVAWLSSFSLTLTGALLLLKLFPLLPFQTAGRRSVVSEFMQLLPGYPSVGYGAGLLIWLNLLLLLPVWLKNRLKQTLPFLTWPFLLFNCGLFTLVLLIGYAFLYYAGLVHVPIGVDGRVMVLGGALALSFGHAFKLRPRLWTAHLLIVAGQSSLILLLINALSLPLIFSLSVLFLLLLIKGVLPPSLHLHEKLHTAAYNYLPINFSLALFALFLMPNLSPGEQLLSLLLLGGSGVALGILGLSGSQKTAQQWQIGGVLLLILALHIQWKIWLPQAQWTTVLPWNALQFAVLSCLLVWIQARGILSASTASVSPENRSIFRWLIPVLSIVATLEWLGHVLFFLTAIMPTSAGSGKAIQLLGYWDNVAAIIAGILLTGLWTHRMKNHNRLVYSLTVASMLLMSYVRLLWVGLTPFTLWDTTALMSIGFIFLLLQRIAPASLALYRMTLIFPLLALCTVPWQVGSLYAGSNLFAATAIFLLIQRNEKSSLPVYLALLALNTGIYLWIPDLYNTYRLVQIYTVPISITVLLMLQLHMLELKPSVHSAVRLTALAALYAGTALDVFLRPEFYIFALALGLSLVGILLGIALHIRAFLFTGVIFFILNITGQLINFYPQDRLSKAILLMVSGGLIAGGMIWFSIQREAIIRQIRMIRADLAKWE
ncbi:MAG: hypothetical protein SD837_14180 [Candidatus Electrothrix scaldis]|nr:MAG: hypothetical protein SD837_14180 [Candidatus Electrothrix sp. GW3-3]